MVSNLIECRECREEKPESEFYRASKPNYVDKICKACKHKVMQARRKALKEELVAYKGGACEKCGYDRCLGALDFHHRDPTTKEMRFNKGNLVSPEKARAEVEKCHLLCKNCHYEVHYFRDPEFLEV